MTTGQQAEGGASTAAVPTLIGYLDQWAYVRLVKAASGKANDDEVAVRNELHAARLAGRAIFPLSKVHYLETWSHTRDHSRRELAAEMFRLSGFLTIAPPSSLWPVEIMNAVRATFGRPDAPAPIQPCGFGSTHAFDRPLQDGELAPQRSERWAMQELALLSGPAPSEFTEEERQRFADGEAFAAKEAAFSANLAAWKTTPRDREQRFRIHTITLFEHDFTGALIGAGVAPDEFAALGPDGLEDLVRAVPTLWTLTELRRVRLANPNAPFKRTDLNDLRALAAALVYCDVVVTDKAWADAAQRTDVGARFGTTVCSKITQAAEAVRHRPPRAGGV